MDSLYDRISKGTISVDEITASMERSTSAGGKYFQSMEKQSKTLNGQISTLKDNFSQFAGVLAEDTTNAISNEFLPAINNAIQEMQEAFSEDGFAGMAEAFANGFTNILMMLVEKTPEIANVAIAIVQNFANSIQENLPMIVESALQIIMTLVQSMLQMMPQFLNMGIQIIIQLIQGIAQQAPELISQIIECLELMIKTIIDNLPLFVNAAVELILALALGLIDAIPDLVAVVPDLVVALVNALLDPEMILKMQSVGPQLIIALAKALIENIPNLLLAVPRIISGLFNALKSTITSTNWKDLGINMVKGIINGITDSMNWVKNKISSWVGSVMNWFKKKLGINSPSKLMKEQVGKWMGIGVVDGYVEGFEKNISSAYDDMQKAINLETEKMSANVQTGNVYNNIMNTTPVQVNGTYTSRLEVNGEILAEVVNDVNEKKDLQYIFGGATVK